MPGTFDNTDSLGGMHVTIGIDDRQVDAGITVTKQKLSAAGRDMAIKVPVRIGDLDAGQIAKTKTAIAGAMNIPRIDETAFLGQLRKLKSETTDAIRQMQAAASAQPIVIRTKIVDEQGRSVGAGHAAARSAGGGHGGLANKNLLSLRGLETSGLVGNATAAFAIIEATRIGAEFAEAASIASHPNRIARKYDAAGSVVNPFADPSMMANAQGQASVQASQMRIGAIEGIPVIGALIRIGDAMTGLSHGLEEKAEALQRSASMHVAAVESNRGALGRIEGLTGNRVGEATAQYNENEEAAIQDVRRSAEDRQKAGLEGADPATIEKLHKTRMEGRIRIGRVAQGVKAENTASFYSAKAAAKERQAADALAAGRGDEAFRLQQEAAELRARGQRDSTITGAEGTDRFEVIASEAVAVYGAGAAQRSLARLRRRQEAGYSIAAAQGSVAANKLRMGQRDFEADQTEFLSDSSINIGRMRDRGEKPGVIAAEEDRVRAEAARREYQHKRDVAQRTGAMEDEELAARLRRQGRGFEAGLRQFENSSARRIALIQDPGERAAATLAFGEQRAGMIAGERNDRRMAQGALEARRSSAELLMDRSLATSVQGERGDIIRQGTAGVNEILSAPERDREKVRKTVIAEMRARLDQLIGVEGGAVAGEVEYGTQVIGDPLGISGLANRNRKLKEEAEAQMRAQERANPDKGNDLLGNIKGLLSDILAKISPGGVF